MDFLYNIFPKTFLHLYSFLTDKHTHYTMRKTHLFTTVFAIIGIVLISFAKPGNKAAAASAVAVAPVASTIVTNDSAAIPVAKEASLSTTLYNKLNLAQKGLSQPVLDYAIKGYEKLMSEGAIANQRYLTVIDFSQSGRKKRFYLIDMVDHKLVMNTFVSHGKNSGVDMATNFSNTPNSEKSSLGFYVTGPTYIGKHGLSLRLNGKEEGFNSNALARGIVVHGAAYVNAGRVNSAYMGRSQGCPALPEAEYEKAINYIKNGTVMFIYAPTSSYIQQSPVLNG